MILHFYQPCLVYFLSDFNKQAEPDDGERATKGLSLPSFNPPALPRLSYPVNETALLHQTYKKQYKITLFAITARQKEKKICSLQYILMVFNNEKYIKIKIGQFQKYIPKNDPKKKKKRPQEKILQLTPPA